MRQRDDGQEVSEQNGGEKAKTGGESCKGRQFGSTLRRGAQRETIYNVCQIVGPLSCITLQ